MFRRKQNQRVQLINATPLKAKSDSHRDNQDIVSLSSSSVWIQPKHGKGKRSSDAKKQPARRSRSLEGCLDNTDHVTILAEHEKETLQYASHPQGLDVNADSDKNSLEDSNTRVGSVLGRRLQSLATPSPSQLTVSGSFASTVHSSHFAQKPESAMISKDAHQVASARTAAMSETTAASSLVGKRLHNDRTQADLMPAKTNYPKEQLEDDPFRDRTDTANSIKFDISYDL